MSSKTVKLSSQLSLVIYEGTSQIRIIDSETNNAYVLKSDSIVANDLDPNTFEGVSPVGSIVPTVDNTFDLGSPTNRWRDVYVGSNSIFVGDAVISADGNEIKINDLSLADAVGVSITTVDYDNLLNKPDLSVYQLASEAFSGSYNDLTDTPTIPSLAGYATETFVNNAVSNLVDTAPATLDTLNELAAALDDDPNFATTISAQLGDKANTADLATVATTGSYADLSNPPSIPSTLTDLSIVDGNDGDVLTTDGLGNFTFQAPTGGSGNVFVNINADTGTTTANTNNDTLTISGGTSIDTEIVGDTLSINFNGTIPADISDLTDTTNVIPAELTDLGITDGEEGDVLTTDGEGNFTFQASTGGGATTLGALTDVDTTGVRNGNVLVYDQANDQWTSAAPSGGGATTLDSLTDVDTSGGGGGPINGDGLFYNSSTGNWEASAPSGGSGSGLGSRQTYNVTTSTLLDNDLTTAEISIGSPGYVLYKIETDAAAWIRLYTDQNLRGIDTIRPIDEDPINVNGLVSEIVTGSADTVTIAPGVIGFNDDNPVANEIPITVTNLSGTSRTITVTVTVIPIEA